MKVEDVLECFAEGTMVTATYDGGTIVGEIVGVATSELPAIGHMYIIKLVNKTGIFWDKYPYSCTVLPRSMLQLADKEDFD